MSYADLDQRSDELARVLTTAGIGPGNIVPVLLPPSALLSIALLAVLKVGAAYAALDTAWSGTRMHRITQLLPGQIAVTGDDSWADLAGRRVHITDDGVVTVDAAQRPPRIVSPDSDAAMVFFTSGSTGEPKAVLSPHRATSRLFANCTFARFDRTTVMAQTAAVPWDAFAMELWGPLLTGGTCALVTERPLTPAGLREIVVAHGVNTVFLTTSLFHLFVEEDLTTFASLRTVLVGGEKLSPTHAGSLLAAWPDLRLVNGYGPVESAVFALSHDVTGADLDGEIPLGRPVPRTKVLVLRTDSASGALCRPGQVGELCIGGDGLAIGYLSDPALTAEKFVTVAVNGQPERLYRTGDLGQLAPDGVFHYHGRLDRQVKIRGRRIEPAGIERLAAAVPGVRRSLALASGDATANATELWLFYLRADASPTESELTAALAAALPAYSVPDHVVAVEDFPLSAHGKVDAQALLDRFAGGANGADRTVSAAGRTPRAKFQGAEEIIAAEIRALLALAAVDHSTSLFALGGSSLTAVRLCSRLAARFGQAVPVSRLMSDPTVAGLAAWLGGADRAKSEPTAPAAPGQPSGAPLTPMQQSFVLQHLRSGADLVNHCLMSWTITGPLDPGLLARAVADVHGRHGYLSACYGLDDEMLAVDSAAPAEFTRLDASDAETAVRLLDRRLRVPLDLKRGLTWRAVLVRDHGSDGWLFGVAVHHAAFDGWSEHVLARDLSVAYAAADQADAARRDARAATAVPSASDTYRMLEELRQAVDLEAQRSYWTRTLAGMPPITWPVPPDPDDNEQRSAEYPLTDNDMVGIARLARRRGVTLLTLLVEGMSEAIYAYTGQDDFGVGVPASSRCAQALQRPIGCLIDTVCVRLRRTGPRSAGPDQPAGIPGLASAVTGALANSDLPFADVVQALRPPRSPRHPLYQVIAAVQDSPAPLLSLIRCRTEIRSRPEIAWPNAEFVIELLASPGRPFRLVATRDPAALDLKTFTSIADGVADWLRLAVAASR